jgi:hypothetical protein
MSVLAREVEKAKNELIKDYFSSLNSLEQAKYLELKAAIVIQKNARKFLCLTRFKNLQKVSLIIQKNFKGFLARTQHENKVNEESNVKNQKFYEYHLTIIQKMWRGFVSRRNKLDYHMRKKYLQKIKQKNEETLTKVHEYSKAIKYELDRKSEDDERKKFYEVASHLHHLVSTKIIPGVYNPPHLPEESKPQVYNTDIEAHLKYVFKQSLRKNNSK